MEIVKSKAFKYILLGFFFLFLFAAYDINFHGPDEPTYLDYTASVIEKGDLNIVNLFYRSGIYISRTYNAPTPHCHGGILLWIPFYAYAKTAHLVADHAGLTGLTIAGLDGLVKCAMSFSTVLFALLAMFFTYRLLRIFFSSSLSAWSILAIFLGTPFFYYVLYNPGNANVVGCLFSVLSILFCSYMVSMKKIHWFLYGLFFSVCVTVKSDLWFQVLFIGPLFITLCFLKKTSWKNGLYLISGFLPVFILRAVNAYLKYGSFYLEEGRFLLFSNVRCFYFFNGLFSAYRGVFYVSPVFLICLLGFIFMAVNLIRDFKAQDDARRMRSIFLFILSAYAIVKLFVVGVDFPEEGFGSRFLIAEFPVFVLLYAQVLAGRRRLSAYFIVLLSVLFIFWNLLLCAETITGLDWVYTRGAPDLGSRIRALKYIYPLFSPKDLALKLKLLWPALPAVFLAVYYLIKKFTGRIDQSFWYKAEKNNPLKGFSLFTAYLCIAYAVITLLNVANNKKNVEKLKAGGFFENAQAMEISEYTQEDFFIPRIELMQYYALKGRLDMYTKIRRYTDKYFTKKDIFGNYSNEAFRLYNVPGVAYRKISDYNKAISCLNASLGLDPQDIDAYMDLGQIYYELNENTKASACFQRIIQLNPQFSHAYIMLGLVYLKTASYAEAIKTFEDVVRIRPTYADAYSYLGDSYYKQKDYDKAMFSYEKALFSDSTRSWGYADLAECYKLKGDYKKAAGYLQKYLYYYPASPELCRNLGELYVRMGDKRNALKQVKYLKALKRSDFAEELKQSIRDNIKNN